MSEVRSLWVPSNDPQRPPMERKRQRSFTTKTGQVVQGKRTDEPKQASFKDRLFLMWKQKYPEPLDGPLGLRLIVVRPSPQGTPKKPTAKNPNPWAWTVKPDWSNFLKLVEDGLTGAAWVDDARIVEHVGGKRQWPGAAPGVLVEVWTACESFADNDRRQVEWSMTPPGRARSDPR